MKSIKAKELITWLEKDVRLKHYHPEYIEKLVEISEIELSGDNELLEKKVEEFKSRFSTDHNVWYDIH
jgi:hypothetical protein